MHRVLFILGIALIGSSCGSSTTSPTPTTGPVVYSVTGTAQHVLITFFPNDGGPGRQVGTTLPFTYSFTGATGESLYIIALIDTSSDTGNVTVSITKNGTLVQSSTATGYPNGAGASGTF